MSAAPQYPFNLYQIDEVCVLVMGDTARPAIAVVPLSQIETCRVH